MIIHTKNNCSVTISFNFKNNNKKSYVYIQIFQLKESIKISSPKYFFIQPIISKFPISLTNLKLCNDFDNKMNIEFQIINL